MSRNGKNESINLSRNEDIHYNCAPRISRRKGTQTTQTLRGQHGLREGFKHRGTEARRHRENGDRLRMFLGVRERRQRRRLADNAASVRGKHRDTEARRHGENGDRLAALRLPGVFPGVSCPFSLGYTPRKICPDRRSEMKASGQLAYFPSCDVGMVCINCRHERDTVSSQGY